MMNELTITEYELLTLQGRYKFGDKLDKLPVYYKFPNGPYKEIVVTFDDESLLAKIQSIFAKVFEKHTNPSGADRIHAHAVVPV